MARYISCDNCGTTFNIDEHTVCPSCGAPYDKDEELRAFENEARIKNDMRDRRLAAEIRKTEATAESIELKNKATKQGRHNTQVGCVIAIVIFFILPVIGGIISGIFRLSGSDWEFGDTGTGQIVEEQSVSANFNEAANTGKFVLTCDKAEIFPGETLNEWSRPSPGTEYVQLHFIAENTGSESVYFNDYYISVSADGYQCKEISWQIPGSTGVQLPRLYLESGNKARGWGFYQIPTDASTITIKYGDYITINLKNTDLVQASGVPTGVA